MINWMRVFNRLFEIINSEGPLYFSGPRFIATVREVDPYFPDYLHYMEQRKNAKESTSRKDYFYDILMSFKVPQRIEIVNAILDQVQEYAPEMISRVRDELGGTSAVPVSEINPDIWNAERLARILENIDQALTSSNYERAVALTYTCLEGFLKAFVRRHVPHEANEDEIIRLSRLVRNYLRQMRDDYPEEALTMLNHIAHTVDRSRNQFSEAHFGEEAARWLAVLLRDLVNSEVRMLLHFL